MFGMSERISEQSGEVRDEDSIKNPSLGWMIGFLFIVSFLGLFSVVPLRKARPIPFPQNNTPNFVPGTWIKSCQLVLQIMIIDYKLIYPSGTATAHLINSFHTPQGAKLAKYGCPYLNLYSQRLNLYPLMHACQFN